MMLKGLQNIFSKSPSKHLTIVEQEMELYLQSEILLGSFDKGCERSHNFSEDWWRPFCYSDNERNP